MILFFLPHTGVARHWDRSRGTRRSRTVRGTDSLSVSGSPGKVVGTAVSMHHYDDRSYSKSSSSDGGYAQNSVHSNAEDV